MNKVKINEKLQNIFDTLYNVENDLLKLQTMLNKMDNAESSSWAAGAEGSVRQAIEELENINV